MGLTGAQRQARHRPRKCGTGRDSYIMAKALVIAIELGATPKRAAAW